MRLKDKVAIITGAGGAQGKVACILFAKEGAKVVAVEKNPQALEETVRRVKAVGGDITPSLTDIRKEEEVQAAVKLAVDTYGKLNVLYNNAAVDVYGGPVTAIEKKTLDFVIDVNLKGYFLFCKHAIPEMIKAGGGSIINITSNATTIGGTGCDAYTAAKGGIAPLSHSIAAEFASKNVRSNVIVPGGIYSEGHQHIAADEKKFAMMKGVVSKSIGPTERFGVPEDIVNCGIWLASDESTYCTGADIIIDGGQTVSRHIASEEKVLNAFKAPSRPTVLFE